LKTRRARQYVLLVSYYNYNLFSGWWINDM
jgi:hypothetical protein